MLDLIYTDEDFIELGVLQDYAYELTYGDAENSFSPPSRRILAAAEILSSISFCCPLVSRKS